MARAHAAAIHRQDMALAQDLAARLCHDLAGLAGTIAGLLDIVQDPEFAADDPVEAMAAASEAAGQMLRRLRLTRAACGYAGGWEPGHWPTLAASVGDSRLQVTLDAAAATLGRSPEFGRVLLNILLLGAEAVRGRGRVALDGRPEGGLAATLTASAGPSIWPDLSLAPPMMTGQAAGARDFQRGWTLRVAADAGVHLIASGPRLDIVPPA
jgi:histidine phosphotransferase ChpT